MKTKFLAAACAMSAWSCSVSGAEAYAGLGTTGVELGYAHKLGNSWGVRGELNFLDYDRDFDTSDVDYDANLKFANAGLFVDYFIAGSFRVTAGALVGERKLRGRGEASGGAITIDGVDYPADGESLRLRARFPDVSPYVGIGWGHAQQGRGLRFYIDAGAAFGRPDVRLRASPGLLAAAGEAAIEAEEDEVQDKADDLRAYPVIKLGIGYAF